MKWTEELDNELIRLIHIGKHHDEIAVELNTTKKSVHNRCFRLKIKTNYHKEFTCKQCGSKSIIILCDKREFCSSKCSGTFNNTGRVHSEESKEKTRKKLTGRTSGIKMLGNKNPAYIDGRSKKDIINGKRKCKYCGEYKIDKKRKTLCDDCRESYYKFYRPSCEFDFDINLHRESFDFSIVKQYGWYSPSNKGNNLSGVSKDHLYSVRDGFINKIQCEIIKHPANCNLMKHADNSSKNSQSSITLEELIERIKIWDENYG